jgi:hypothetical protein
MEPILLSDDTSASVSPIAINCCLTAEYKQCYSATAGGVTLCKSTIRVNSTNRWRKHLTDFVEICTVGY